MHRVGRALMGLGLGVGVAAGAAMAAHLGVAHVPWLVNVALVKLGLFASASLMAGGAMTIRVAQGRRAHGLLASHPEESRHSESPITGRSAPGGPDA